MSIERLHDTAAQRPNTPAHLRWLIGAFALWLLARGVRKAAWTLFGLYWTFHWMR